MPELKWQAPIPVAPDKEYLVMASRLPLKRFWLLPRFMRYAFAVGKQLRASKGIVWYSLLAHMLRSRFWTLSAWEDRETLQEFTRNLPHSRMMVALKPYLSETKFVQWKVPGSAVPPTWREAFRAPGY